MLGTTDYRTDAYFALDDVWLPTAAGETTHLHDEGTGTPVVFLHGSGTGVSAAANWWKTLPAVAGSMRAIAPDLIGYGATLTAPDTRYGIREWGAHTLRVLDALGIDQTWLVGNSLGGWIALQLAIDHPDRVLGVVSMGTGGSAPSAAIRSHATPDTSIDGIRRSLRAFVDDDTLISDELVTARRQVALYDVSSGRLDEVIGARERDRAALPLNDDDLAQITMPVLLMHGTHDHVIPPERTWGLLNACPSADAVLLRECGHWLQIERSALFARLVTDFVTGTWTP